MSERVRWDVIASAEPHLHRVGERLAPCDAAHLVDRLRLEVLHPGRIPREVEANGRGLEPDLVAYAAEIIGALADAGAHGYRPPEVVQVASALAAVWGRLARPRVLEEAILAEVPGVAGPLRRALCRPPTRSEPLATSLRGRRIA